MTRARARRTAIGLVIVCLLAGGVPATVELSQRGCTAWLNASEFQEGRAGNAAVPWRVHHRGGSKLSTELI